MTLQYHGILISFKSIKLKKIYIVIVNYNGWKDTIECLLSLFSIDYLEPIIVVVDNNSPNQSLKHIENWLKDDIKKEYSKFLEEELDEKKILSNQKKLLLIQAKKNKGFAAGNNLFLKHILNDDGYIWLLNPDMVAAQDSLKALVNNAESSPPNTVLGSIVKDFKTREKILFYGGSTINKLTGTTKEITKLSQLNRLDYISGGAFFTSIKNFKTVGLFPEHYFLYWEETDWCTQAKMKGIGLTVCLQSITYDKISTSIGKGYLAEYYYSLNALRFAQKYSARNTYTILAFNVLRIAKRLVYFKFGNMKAIMDASIHFIRSKNEIKFI